MQIKKKPSSAKAVGLYANINAKRKRIAAGSGEKMRKAGSKGAPTAKAFKQSAKTAKKKPVKKWKRNPQQEKPRSKLWKTQWLAERARFPMDRQAKQKMARSGFDPARQKEMPTAPDLQKLKATGNPILILLTTYRARSGSAEEANQWSKFIKIP